MGQSATRRVERRVKWPAADLYRPAGTRARLPHAGEGKGVERRGPARSETALEKSVNRHAGALSRAADSEHSGQEEDRMPGEGKGRAPMGLRQMKVGQHGSIVSVAAEGELGRRIRDMGLIPGTDVEVVGHAPLRDPVALRLFGVTLALRNREADFITVEVR